MSRIGLISAIALSATTLASSAWCATPVAPPIDLSTAFTDAQAQLKAAGRPVDVTSMANGAADIANATLGALGDAMAGMQTTQNTPATLEGAVPMTGADLGATSGGSNNTFYITAAASDQTLTATNTGNSITTGGGITNGALTIDTNAFAGFNGIGNFVMNTGNQNNLQGTLSVNIVMTPPVSAH